MEKRMLMKLKLILALTMVIQISSCSFIFELGFEPTPTVETLPAATLTKPVLPIPMMTIPPTESETYSSSPTALPGSVVFPITSLGKDIPWLTLDKAKVPVVRVITFNTRIPPFDNPLVRQAFAAAIDRDAIVKMAQRWSPFAITPATNFIPPQTLGRNLYGEVGIKYDPARARELLIQAGYPDLSSFPVATFIVNSAGLADPYARYNMATAMAEMWKTNLGVTVKVEAIKPPGFGDRLNTNPPELSWVGWTVDAPGNDPDFIRSIYRTGGEYNIGSFSSREFDSWVDQAAASHDPAMRQALYIQAERILCEVEAGIIPLYHSFISLP